MTVEPLMLWTCSHETVEAFYAEGTSDEKRFSVEAHIQPGSGYIAFGTPVCEGDIVEFKDPRGGIERKLVSEAKLYDSKGTSIRNMRCTQLKWGKVLQLYIASVAVLLSRVFIHVSLRQSESSSPMVVHSGKYPTGSVVNGLLVVGHLGGQTQRCALGFHADAGVLCYLHKQRSADQWQFAHSSSLVATVWWACSNANTTLRLGSRPTQRQDRR